MPERVLGVLNGGDIGHLELLEWARSSSMVLCADGGANALLTAGFQPGYVIGDMDSIDPNLRDPAREVPLPDRELTDCDKLLKFAAQQGVEAITLVGVEGDRPDHVLATMCSSLHSELQVRLAMRRFYGWPLGERAAIGVPAWPGALVSLLPLGRAVVSLAGVQWPLEAAELDSGGRVSISNRALANCVEAEIHAGACVLFVERSGSAPEWL